MGPPGGRTDRLLLDEGRLVDRSSFRGRGRDWILGDEAGSFFTVILGAVLLCDALSFWSSLRQRGSTYGDEVLLLFGESLEA